MISPEPDSTRKRRQVATTIAVSDSPLPPFNGTNNHDEDSSAIHNKLSKKELYRRRGMTLALFMTYFSVIGVKSALPSVFSLLTSNQGLNFDAWKATPRSLMARELIIAAFAVAIGKFLLGPVIDRYGGVTSLKLCLFGIFACVIRLAVSTSFTNFAICWTLVDFMFSSCWAACIHAVHQSFPPEQWTNQIAILAAATRTGNAIGFFIYSAVLEHCQGHYERPWQVVFGCSAALPIIPISLLYYFGSRKPDLGLLLEKKRKPSIAKSLNTLRNEANTPAFWFHLISRSVLMVFGSFLLFIPTLMIHVYGTTHSQAARVGSLFALGCLSSITIGSQRYSNLSRRSKMMAVGTLMGIATICAFSHLAHMMKMHKMTASISTWSFFLWGFSYTIPFYIPPSMYSLNRGGRDSSATIADVFDIGGYTLLAFFNGYVASINHDSVEAWIPTFCILTGCAAISAITLSLAVYFE